MVGRTATAQLERVLLELVLGGESGAADRMSQSASAAAAKKLCQMGRMRGAVRTEREGSKPDTRPARWRRVSVAVGLRDLGLTLKE